MDLESLYAYALHNYVTDQSKNVGYIKPVERFCTELSSFVLAFTNLI